MERLAPMWPLTLATSFCDCSGYQWQPMLQPGASMHTGRDEADTVTLTSWSSCTEDRKLTREAKPSGKM
jgi:hypothetical protein